MKKILLFIFAIALFGAVAFAEGGTAPTQQGSDPCGLWLCHDAPWNDPTSPLFNRPNCETLGSQVTHNFTQLKCCYKNVPTGIVPERDFRHGGQNIVVVLKAVLKAKAKGI